MIGYTPREVDQMSLWEFGACIRGWKRANCAAPTGPQPPTAEQHAEAMAYAASISRPTVH